MIATGASDLFVRGGEGYTYAIFFKMENVHWTMSGKGGVDHDLLFAIGTGCKSGHGLPDLGHTMVNDLQLHDDGSKELHCFGPGQDIILNVGLGLLACATTSGSILATILEFEDLAL